MIFPKLTKKQKEFYKLSQRISKITDELIDIHFGKVKETKCTRCSKKIKTGHLIDCRKKTNKVLSGKGIIHDSALSFGLIPKLFNSAIPFVVCSDCRNDIYRFMGKIPDLSSPTVFPQHLWSYKTITEFTKDMKSKKQTKGHIEYKKKKYTYTAKKLELLRKQAVTAYLQKYPYVKFTISQLLRICKVYKLHDKVEVWH